MPGSPSLHTDLTAFGAAIALVGLAVLGAVGIGRFTERIRIPAPALFLVAAACAAQAWPRLGDLGPDTTGQVVSIALAVVLFEGGLQLGARQARAVLAPVLLLGVVGTFLTTAGVGALGFFVLGLGGWSALLVGAAVAPTDPAVVLAVLGRQAIGGRSAAVLIGESGANDPVGIALMVGLIAGGGVSAGALRTAAGEFCLQLFVGAAVGLLGAWALGRLAAAADPAEEALASVQMLAGLLLIFGVALVAHGSGFLAVFLAGICLGDRPTPHRVQTGRFLAALAGLGEIVAFVALGLTIDLDVLVRDDVWLPGLIVATALAFLVRPLLIGACLLPFRLRRNERAFVLWAGLKGAVPILLGTYLLTAAIPDADRLYGIVVVAVLFSVVVQGATVAPLARRLRIS